MKLHKPTMKLHKPTMRNFRSDQEAVRKLSPEQFRVTQRSATERPGTGEYLQNEEPGIYVDVAPRGPRSYRVAASRSCAA